MRARKWRTRLAAIIATWVGWWCMASITGCVEKKKQVSKVDRELAKEIVLDNKPEPEHELDVRFENKIRLLGYELSAPAVVEKKPFEVTWYWQVNEPLGEGWKIFTHLADARKISRINLDAARAVRRAYPVTEWKRGDYIKDTQEVVLPDDWDSDTALFYVGFWNGPHRLHVTKGKSDGDNRALALEVPVKPAGSKAEEPSVKRLVAHKTKAAVTLDGKLDEAAWQRAESSGAFVNTRSGNPGAFEAKVRVLYDAEHLYLGYEVEDDLLRASHKKHDDHLWEQDTVEVMVDPGGDGKNYFEIQASPRETVFDTRYDSRRKPQPFGHVDWESDTKAAVQLNGTLGDKKEDEGYIVEMAIPFRAFAAGKPPASPPAAGETWRMNFYVMDLGESNQRAVGWSPPKVGDFHVPARFGRVVFPEAAAPASSKDESSKDESSKDESSKDESNQAASEGPSRGATQSPR